MSVCVWVWKCVFWGQMFNQNWKEGFPTPVLRLFNSGQRISVPWTPHTYFSCKPFVGVSVKRCVKTLVFNLVPASVHFPCTVFLAVCLMECVLVIHRALDLNMTEQKADFQESLRWSSQIHRAGRVLFAVVRETKSHLRKYDQCWDKRKISCN